MQMTRRALVPGIIALLSLFAQMALAQDEGPLPEGPGVNLVYAKCQQCHPINYVVDSAGLPDFLWQDTLSLMKQLGMHVTEEEEETLYEYLTTYLGTDPPPAPATDEAAAGDVDGGAVYAGSCAVCHGPEGRGTGTAFPPLAGHAAKLASADRGYLPLVVLYGLAGKLNIGDNEYNGVMPAWGQLNNKEIAAVLNEVVAGWGSSSGSAKGTFEPYTPEEIAAARGLGLSATDVHERRPEITAEQ